MAGFLVSANCETIGDIMTLADDLARVLNSSAILSWTSPGRALITISGLLCEEDIFEGEFLELIAFIYGVRS